MQEKHLKDLFEDTIKDIYSSETLLLKAMPDMMEAAKNPRLKNAIQQHIGQTENQVIRIREVAKKLGFDPEGVTCQGTVGLIKEAKEHLKEFGGTAAGDAAIVACAQKNEHYEIGNYGTAIAWAKLMGNDEIASLLAETLKEEEDTDEILSEIARDEVNEAALATTGKPKGKAKAI